MKKTITRTIAYLMILCMILCMPVFAYGEEVQQEENPEAVTENVAEVEPAEETAEEVEPEVQEQKTQVLKEEETELKLEVEYDKNIKCGQPTEFDLVASQGTGVYSYHFNSVARCDKNFKTIENVVDPTKMKPYQSNTNEYEFTFYASGYYQLWFDVMDKGKLPYKTTRCLVNVTVDDSSYPSVETVAEAVAQECTNAGCTSDYEKALWFHDWLLDNCTYDNSLFYCGVEGALCRGTGTCEAYHRAYELLLNTAGMQTGRMEGNFHVWTAVKMDNEWYQVDVTWDDNDYAQKKQYENHIYFGLTDELMQLAHSQHTQHAGYVSNSFENNYLLKSGEIKEWSEPLEEEAQAYLDKGETMFSLEVGNALYDTYNKTIIYSLAAEDLKYKTWQSGSKYYALDAQYSEGDMVFSFSEMAPEDNPGDGTHMHNFGQWTITKNASCTERGEKKRVCKICGYEDIAEIVMTGHNYSEWVTTKEASCSERGSQKCECKNCGKEKTRVVAEKEHNWEPATCTSLKTCKDCGYSWGHFAPHQPEFVTVDPAGYLHHGYGKKACKHCGEVLQNNIRIDGWSNSYVKSFKVKKGKKCFTAKWKKQSKKNRKNFAGYQVRYSANANMAGAAFASAGNKSRSKKIKGLGKKQTYYVQVRTYTNANGSTFYSGWSAVKRVTTK